MDLPALLAELESAPNLRGASCASPVNRAVFDLAMQLGSARHAGVEAAAICSACPALAACREWVDGLSARERPVGVIAGVRVGVRRSQAA